MDRESVQDKVGVALLEPINVDQGHHVHGVRAVGVLLDSFHVFLNFDCWGDVAVEGGALEGLVGRGVVEEFLEGEGHGSEDELSVETLLVLDVLHK